MTSPSPTDAAACAEGKLPSPGAPSPGARWFERPGAWLWCVLAVGATARLGLAWFSAGTTDVQLWSRPAAGVSREGLIEHYAVGLTFNHPPPMAWLAARLWELCGGRLAVFAAAFRTLPALGDLLAAYLLWVALSGHARRALCVAAYLVAPVAIVLAGQHGNSDALVGVCLLGAVIAAGRGQAAWAGALVGLSAWIKLPGLLAAPIVAFAMPRRRDFWVGVAALATGLKRGLRRA
jgi:hypothetical protein